MKTVLTLLLILIPAASFGQEWSVIAHPTTHDLRRADFLDAERGWAIGDSGTVVMTSDGGLTWEVQASGTDFDIIDISMADSLHGWIVAQEYPVDTIFKYGTEVFRTTDGGETWVFQTRFEQVYYHAVEFFDPLNGFLGGHFGEILWTEDGGNIWNEAVIDSMDYARWPIWRFKFFSPSYGTAMGGLFDVTGLVWKTTDGGKYWTHRRVAGEPIFDCHFFDSLNVLCVSGDIDFGSGMVRTTNGGGNWTYTYLGIWGQATSVSFRTPDEGWAPLGFASTYMTSFDGGVGWESSFTPDSTAMFDVVFIDSTVGYMVGREGTIMKYTGPPVGVNGPVPQIPLRAGLSQNYPNPFNATSHFGFRISPASPEGSGRGRADFGFVSLIIYDLLGREVATIVNETLPPGTYTRQWDAGDLPSGVYYYRLMGPGINETRKLVLLK